MAPHSREPVEVSESLLRRLNSYALAASAAGVGIFCLAQHSEAKVIYTAGHKWLPLNQDFYLDLNHDGVDDFHFLLRAVRWSTSMSVGSIRDLFVGRVTTRQSQNAIYSVISQSYACAAPLAKGKRIGPKSRGFKSQLGSALMFSSGSRTGGMVYLGPWLNITHPAYVGVKFASKGKVHYGWVRLAHVSPSKPPTAELTGYAYETVPNKPIIAGKTKGPDVVTVQPASLGHLAYGAGAIPAWRAQH
jgi:hypothetical protein